MPVYLRRQLIPHRHTAWVPSARRLNAVVTITQAVQTLTVLAEVDLLAASALTQAEQIMLSMGTVANAGPALSPNTLIRVRGQQRLGVIGFAIKPGVTLPTLPLTLWRFSDSGEVPADLTDASSIVLRLHRTGTRDAVIELPAMVVAAATGDLDVEWASALSYPQGLYDSEARVAWASGAIEKFPNDGFFVIQVGATL